MRVIGARSFPIAEGIDLFHLKEEIEPSELTAKEAVMSVDTERSTLEAEADVLNDLMTDESCEDQAECMDRLNQIYERLDELDAATAEVRASKILTGLGFTAATQQKKCKDFSGGWRMRIALARALFIQPTLLLLDEPTNHLDMEAVVWLEDYLSKWDKILLMVSHSQDFMNNVCTHIMHLRHKKLNYFTGNYDTFVQTREEKEEEQMKKYQWEQDQIKHMKEYVARFGQGNAKMARQAQSKEKVLEKMQRSGLTEKVEAEKALDFKFPDPGNLSPPVLQCNELAFGYPGCEVLYEGVDLGVDLESRVALVGPNGAGKSTLLKILTGDLQPLVGSIRPHAHLRISKFSQHFIDVLDLQMNPIDYFMDIWKDLTLPEARKFLGRFGITGQVQTTKMEHLSDGQKSRVVLAKMAKETPHILFLDEPTNHLDMESIDSLAKAINNFEGGMVLVSHDMRLISQVAKEIWICDNRTVSKYCGEIHDFKMHLRRTLSIDGDAKSAPPLPTVPLTCKALGGEKPLVPSKAPLIAPKAPSAPSSGKSEEEEAIMKARMELADLAIAKQRARQAAETGTDNSIAQASETSTGSEELPEPPTNAKIEKPPKAPAPTLLYDDDGNLITEGIDEKTLKKLKKKAEKEKAAELEKREEEERKARRIANQSLFDDAAKFKKEQAEMKELAEKRKAEIEQAKKEIAEAEAAAIAEAKAKRREARAARKAAKQAARAEAMAKAKEAMDAAVLADHWTQEQQNKFEAALLENPGGPRIDKTERWKIIAGATEGKTMNQCIMRYRYLKEYVAKRKEIENS